MSIVLDGTTGITTPGLTNSGSQTVSAGTANGVTYLNGSKVLTSGSALTFDGTSLQLGTGGTTPAVKYGNGYQTLTGASDSNDFTYRTYANHIWKNTTSAGSITDGTELMRLTSTGLGIGTSSPSYPLHVNATGNGTKARFTNGTTTLDLYCGGTEVYTGTAGSSTSWAYATANTYIAGYVNGAERVRITSGGFLGVATTSPQAPVHAVATTTIGTDSSYAIIAGDASSTNRRLLLGYTGSGNGYGVIQGVLTGTAWTDVAINPNGGNLLVGTTTTNPHSSGTYGVQINKTVGLLIGVDNSHAIIAARWNANGEVIRLQRDNTDVGSIDVTTTATSYNTSSDYRLKENIAPMVGALTTVAQLKPCTYTWKVNGTSSQGFIAHELQAVVPECVTGEKDAVDEEGNPKYQGIDTSFLVATLTAAIKEQQAIITTLTERVTALEGA